MKLLGPMMRKQSGQALPMALVLLALGAMIIVPTLVLTTTNLTATRVVDAKTRNIYAADAGVEQGLWEVEHNNLPVAMLGEWNETTYDTYELNPYTYSLYDSDDPDDTVTVNDRNVDITITPVWPLQGLEASSLPQERTPDPNDHVLTFGGLNGDGDYEISIFKDGTVDPLLVKRIGCWLPPGYDIVPGSSNLQKGTGQPYYCIPVKVSHNGGWTITWNFSGSGINYNNLPTMGSKKIVTFEFTPSEEPTDAFSWTMTNRPNFPLSWDMSKKVYEIESQAPSGAANQTTVVAHSVKKEFQALGSAISGDYQATGVTMMRDHDSDPCPSGWSWLECAWIWRGDQDRRERLYNQTGTPIKSTTEDPTYGIPDDATVEQIFLYWTGWKCKPWDVHNLTAAQLAALPLSQTGGKYLNKVRFKVNVNGTEFNQIVTASSPPQVLPNLDIDGHSPHGWTYSCVANVTSQVLNYFDGQGVPFYGKATYTVGHWDTSSTYNASTYRYALYTWNDNHTLEPAPGSAPNPPLYTRYPLGSPKDGNQTNTIGTNNYEDSGVQDEWSHAAWSVVIIYSSPSSTGHHLYIHDTFRHCNTDDHIPFTIKGFLAPPDVASDPNAARMTCFVAEGDNQYTGDRFQVNGHDLADSVNPANNVWNGKSNVLGGTSSHEGIDIDTFIAGGGTIIQPGAIEATINMPTPDDNWNLVYIVLSFRSEPTTGGMIDYHVE
jgi:hypothetical protein